MTQTARRGLPAIASAVSAAGQCAAPPGKLHGAGRLPRFGDGRAMRIGLLGGSFNPAHEGHRHVAEIARKRLGLDQIWLMVSPGNPLKPATGMGSPAQRLASAQRLADGRRVIATDIEASLGTRYTQDTLRVLRQRFPRAQFVWLMGADNLEQFVRWRGWRAMARKTQIAVLPRPTYNQRALSAQAAHVMRHARIAARAAPALTGLAAPAWVFLDGRQVNLSATDIRRQTGFPHRHHGEDP